VEEYCLKKSKRRLSELITHLILGNISKDTVTISLLHRVFSLGLRTIVRVRDFFAALYRGVKDDGVTQYLIENHQAMFAGKLIDQVNKNLDEITKKLSIDQSFAEQTKKLFEVRLREVQTVALSADFKLFLKPSCNLEEEISNVALKLSMQREEPREPSVLVNRLEIIFEKYKENNSSQAISVFASKVGAWTYLESFILNSYSRQQEESKRSALVSKKFAKDKGDEDKLEIYLEMQKKLDLKALETLIMG
jgi:hypothetical protein